MSSTVISAAAIGLISPASARPSISPRAPKSWPASWDAGSWPLPNSRSIAPVNSPHSVNSPFPASARHRGCSASKTRRRYGSGGPSGSVFGLAIGTRSQPIRYRTISRDPVGHDKGQDQLGQVQPSSRYKSVALIDQIENGSDDQRDDERTLRHAVGYATEPNPRPLPHRASLFRQSPSALRALLSHQPCDRIFRRRDRP